MPLSGELAVTDSVAVSLMFTVTDWGWLVICGFRALVGVQPPLPLLVPVSGAFTVSVNVRVALGFTPLFAVIITV